MPFHCLIAYEYKSAARELRSLLIEWQPDAVVHLIDDVKLVRPVMLAFPISVVLMTARAWDPSVFRGVTKLPLFVMLCNNRECMNEEPLQGILHLKEPFLIGDVTSLMLKLKRSQPARSIHFVLVKSERHYRVVMFDQIELIEKKDKMYVMIYTHGDLFLVPGTINDWWEKLPLEGFVKASDGLILPVAEVKNILGDKYAFRGREINLVLRSGRKKGRG